ncbi:glycoside hydrolase family 2 TIM barrel-domain containing protein [Kiritimatiellota bacterium B12222]|nr:glycoside hydrolase family 2 TIM barrel-domain containing protein [Kiritimatiellota bacterium B12222]
MRIFTVILVMGLCCPPALWAGGWPQGPEGEGVFVKGVTFTIQDTAQNPQAQLEALAEVKAMGATAIRTWGVGEDTPALLDHAHAQGLKVLVGLWLEHGRDGAENDGDLNYLSDDARKSQQREKVLQSVASLHEHPAVLGWGLGNEVILNIGGEDQKVAYAQYLEELVQAIKAIDPVHPVISVSAWTLSVPYWQKYTPSLDVYGINAYGAAAGVIPDDLERLGVQKPYLVTEFGPRGAWDSPKDDLGVPQMPSDAEKYQQISTGWGEWIVSNRGRGCVGGFVFNFGNDDSPTSLWLDFYVKGLKRPAYWATREAFTGQKVDGGIELLEEMLLSPSLVSPGQILTVGFEPLTGDDLGEIAFVYSPEFGERAYRNRMFPVQGKQVQNRVWKVLTPVKPGVYRLYAIQKSGEESMTVTQASVEVKEREPMVEMPVVAPSGSAVPTVMIQGDEQVGYQLMKEGKPFVIHGAGGSEHFDVLAVNGGNAVRTWGVGPDTPELLKRAHAQGISVTLGLWLGHERHGFNYSDAKQVAEQRREVEAAVKKYRNHPALLSWGLGNEMEGIQNRGDSPVIWKEVNYLAEMIKSLDKNHPVMTVVANVNPDKVTAIKRYAPAIDILGVNAYAGAQNIGNNLKNYGWTKPYAITEYGLPGPWEVEHTDWDAPLEPTSREKAGFYYIATKGILEDTHQCLGAYAFIWGSKQEATASWFGMFLPSGEKTPRVDAITRAWTGEWPENRAPVLKETEMPMFNQKVRGGESFSVKARYEDADGDRLRYHWEVREESRDRKVGGDQEAAPELVKNAVKKLDDEGNALLKTPKRSGAYRLFVTVKDGKGSGCMDNWPFYVR